MVLPRHLDWICKIESFSKECEYDYEFLNFRGKTLLPVRAILY